MAPNSWVSGGACQERIFTGSGLGAREIFKEGLMRWGAVGTGQSCFTLSVMDRWTRQDEGHVINLDELVSVLLIKLFSWFRDFPGAEIFLSMQVRYFCLFSVLSKRASWFQFSSTKDRGVTTNR